jgi:predicted XRE-type DNA-binding protein
MTDDDLKRLLERAVKSAGSQKAAAESLGVSQAYLCDVMNGRAAAGDKILTSLGLRKRIVYERVRA